MKKMILTAMAILIATAGLALAAEPPAGPAKVTNYGAKTPVTFDHAKHAKKASDCIACHHNEAKGVYKCGTCHGAEEKDKAPAIKDAMHAKEKGVCYACHLKADAAQKKKCADCHAG